MALRDEMERAGTRLFRGRSYLPMPMLALLLVSMRNPPIHGDVNNLHAWDLLCLAVGLAGLAIRCLSLGYAQDGTSSRRTRDLTTNGLNTTGMYSVVRHPLYLGNYLLWLAPTLFCRSLPLIVIVTLVFWIYYERIMLAEEQQLRQQFGDAFEQWASRTPAFMPRWTQWQQPDRPFRAHKVLLSESSSLLALMLVLFLFELLVGLSEAGTLMVDPWWVALLTATTAVSLYVRIYKSLRKRARHATRSQVLSQERLS